MSQGNGHDDEWENLGSDVRGFMSNAFRQSEEVPHQTRERPANSVPCGTSSPPTQPPLASSTTSMALPASQARR